MSFDQALICHGKNGIFAAPWLAATYGSQALTKYYQTNNINSIDIGKTCDALRSTLKSDFSKIRHDPELKDPGNRDVVKEGFIPFRICTNIWFGTLKIYQQQVNILYKQSEDLVVGSSNWLSRSKTSQKRKKQSNNKNLLKKQKLSITDSDEIDLSNRNYSQLLDDLEKLTQHLPEENSEDEQYSTTVMPEQMTNMLPKTQFQIREITIREISATTYGIAELDDDDGFGEASPEEITTFFTFSAGGEKDKLRKGVSNKRKSGFEDEPPQKQVCYDHGTNIEVACEHRESTPLCGDFIPTPCRIQRTCELSCDKTSSLKNEIQHDIKEEEPCQNSFELATHLGAPADVAENKFSPDLQPNHNKPKRKSKLVIDQCIKIELEMMMQQLTAPIKLCKGSPIEYLRNLKYKKRETASGLLKRLNKRTERFRPVSTLKNIPNIPQSQFEYDFIQILHEMFTSEYKDSWATEIYPEWQNSCKQNKGRKNKAHQMGITCDTARTITNFLCENSDLVSYDENNNPKIDITNIITMNLKQGDNKDIEPTNEVISEWGPSGVMTKLLDTWRYCADTKIDAVEFCHSAKMVTDMALAFSSLLSLSKDQFVEINKRPETIYMDKILLGQAVKILIKMEN